MNREEKFYFDTAVYFLKNRFGIEKPTNMQIEEMKSLLFHSWIRKKIEIDKRLTKREKMCLLLASQGKTYIEIAKTLGINPSTIKTYERKILKKLNCKSMKQAVVIGLRYSDIHTKTNLR